MLKLDILTPQKAQPWHRTHLLTEFCGEASNCATFGRDKETKKTKKETYCGTLAIHPDYLRHLIKI